MVEIIDLELERFVILTSKTLKVQLRSNAEGLAIEEVVLTEEEKNLLAILCQDSSHNLSGLMKIMDKYVKAGFKIGLKKAEILIQGASQ